jgi:uncharacterized protein with NAD-binding domain and iron-sulfur cluster
MSTPGTEKEKVVILGGGAGAMAAAWSLSSQGWQDRFESITVYQRGWRLGGKGASGRAVNNRIQEHGLHIWFGFYDNSFRMLRRCYEEREHALGSSGPFRSVDDAFERASSFVLMERRPEGWLPWVSTFPEDDRRPGFDVPQPPSLWQLLQRALALALSMVRDARFQTGQSTGDGGLRLQPAGDAMPPIRLRPLPAEPAARPASSGRLADAVQLALQAASSVRTTMLERAEGSVAAALDAAREFGEEPSYHFPAAQEVLRSRVEEAAADVARQFRSLAPASNTIRRRWYVIDLLLACVRGILHDDLLVHGTDVVDDVDFAEWLERHGADAESARSALITSVVYDMPFAYRDGDPRRPAGSAACALRGLARLFFDYKGAIAWKMRAGMGDVVFAPLYEVLKHRGVQFKFFHHVDALEVSDDDAARVQRVRLTRQIRLLEPYEPLIEVEGLRCWPAEPRWGYLDNSSGLSADDLEFGWSLSPADSVTLEYGRDFHWLVLGISLGALPEICRDLVERNSDWQAMTANLATVPTQALQVWLRRSTAQLGDPRPGAITGAFTEPFDTYADMSHLLEYESWPEQVKGLAYFCSPLPARPGPARPVDRQAHQEANDQVRRNALRFLEHRVPHLLPGTEHRYPAGFRWDLLADPGDRVGPERLNGQFWRANVEPSDRYVQSLPGTSRFRLPPGRSGFENLVLAGDWTDCGLNSGCFEAAVTSGLAAGRGIPNSPDHEEIIGLDHLRGRDDG